ncbi:phosphoserine phosphatase SerB [Georgenia muralis]|uniref:phosphoserine phosphatase n=1 Tax=Georgenia muralis TaxID=154117 RepID=A0A3N4Z6U9_9MICO|nr:phosphoserine phosphatase SerB [Georgenia muralis]RPF28053.1 phosphoserine phosphatase SerB [Georgenia muralis]
MNASPDRPTLRVGLVSPRPLPVSLVEHARELVAAVADDAALVTTSRGGWFAVAVTASLRDGGGAGAVDARHLRTELGGPAAALGVDVGVTTGALAQDGPGLLVMDVDSTLITAEVIELLAEHAGTRAEVAAVTERAMRGEIDFADSLRARVATLAGLDVAVLADVRAAVELTPGARELVEAVHAGGGRVGVVSGGFVEVVEPLRAGLGIDHAVANALEVRDGRLTGRTLGPVVDRAAKEAQLRRWAAADDVPLERVVAVGDGANDLDMLGAAGFGVAFRAKPVVQEEADAAVTFPRLDAVWGLLGR